MTSPAFHDLFGGGPRKPETPLSQREMDLAASIQAVTEEVVMKLRGLCQEGNRRSDGCAWPAVSRSTAWPMASC